MKLKKIVSSLLLLSAIVIDAYACGAHGKGWGHQHGDGGHGDHGDGHRRRRWCPECPECPNCPVCPRCPDCPKQQPCPSSPTCPISSSDYGSGSSDNSRFNACPCSGAFPIDSTVASDDSKIAMKISVPKLELSQGGLQGWLKWANNEFQVNLNGASKSCISDSVEEAIKSGALKIFANGEEVDIKLLGTMKYHKCGEECIEYRIHGMTFSEKGYDFDITLLYKGGFFALTKATAKRSHYY